jgi:DNA (cytosine-5)-methyltransferase 1
MTHLGLFEGIGGFSLAAKWMGWETLAWCEWNEFGQKVLRYHFPEAEGFGDITKTNFKKYANRIDILTGGFPCQPYSMAGKRLGKEDDRHLWPEMLRVIREVQPTWVVGENVFGLVNWSGGLVFHEVQADLEAEGYEVQPYVLPAVSVNAPHRRDRVWFVAYSHSNGSNKRNSQHEVNTSQGRLNALSDPKQSNGNGDATDTNSSGIKRQLQRCKRKRQSYRCNSRINKPTYWQTFPTVSPICNGDDGLSNRLDSITFPKWRAESIKAGGNAIVPQVAYQIFKAIEQYNNQ